MDEWRRAVTAGPILEGTRQLHHKTSLVIRAALLTVGPVGLSR
jgi:hypothetical protein